MFSSNIPHFSTLILFIAGQMFAANSDWAVVEALPAGTNVRIQFAAGKVLKGQIQQVTRDSISIGRGAERIEVDRLEVRRVYTVGKKRWIRSALIGSAIGAGGAGAAAPAFLEHEIGYGGAVAGTVIAGALAGAAVGSLLARPMTRMIYEAANPSLSSSGSGLPRH